MSSGKRAQQVYEDLMGAELEPEYAGLPLDDDSDELKFGHSRALRERLDTGTTVTQDEYYALNAQWEASPFGPDIPESAEHHTYGDMDYEL